jgi:hypothetical protein
MILAEDRLAAVGATIQRVDAATSVAELPHDSSALLLRDLTLRCGPGCSVDHPALSTTRRDERCVGEEEGELLDRVLG